MRQRHLACTTILAAAPFLAALAAPTPGFAAPVAKLAQTSAGSGNTVVIEPPVPHPASTPCIVKLYRGATFGGNNVNFNYAPPTGCPGPWGAVVLSVDVSLNAGIQYDRTGTIWLAGVPLWFGTTAEPTPQLGPSWHFERDVTEYSALYSAPQTGFVLIANYTNSTDTSIITSTAQLLFYPPTTAFPAPRVPDQVIPLANPGGGTVALNSGSDTVSISQTLPTNIENATLQVYPQGQSTDEFWYTCVPTALSGELESCGSGSLREGEITVDGTPAGVVPVYPWIFTGGLDPYLWSPIPGIQTLSFKPFGVPLAPFAGVLSNGAPHTISLSVYGADSYFSVAGALLLYLDSGSTQVTGSVTGNNLAAQPTPVITNGVVVKGNITSGPLTTASTHDFTITGTAVTSKGTLQYTVNQLNNFTNTQKFFIGPTAYRQLISQDTTTAVQTSTTNTTTNVTTTNLETYDYPLTVDLNLLTGAKGNLQQVSNITQGYNANRQLFNGENYVTEASTVYNLTATDDLFLNPSYEITGHTGQASTAHESIYDQNIPCFNRRLAAKNNILTLEKTGCAK